MGDPPSPTSNTSYSALSYSLGYSITVIIALPAARRQAQLGARGTSKHQRRHISGGRDISAAFLCVNSPPKLPLSEIGFFLLAVKLILQQ